MTRIADVIAQTLYAHGVRHAFGMPGGEVAVAPPKAFAAGGAIDGDAVTEAAKLLQTAERPLILAGLEAARDKAGDAVRQLMERFGLPLITTYKAKGLVDETHPLALGGAGLSPLADKDLLPLVQAADLVLLAGYDPIEMRAGWLDPFADDAAIIEVTACPPDHGMHHATMLVETPPRAFLDALMKALDRGSVQAGKVWQDGEPIAVGERLGTLFTPPSAWGPHHVFDVLQNALPDDALITVDSGAHRILLSQQLKIRQPFGLMQSAGFCTMGAAVPLAAGARIAHGGRPVVAVLGDGGLEMGLGELATLRDENAPVVIVVLQDESLALIELKQTQAGLERRGVRLGKTKFEDIAAAFGGRGWRVTTRHAFDAALSTALKGGEFSIIVCEIQVGDYAGKF